MLRRRATVSTVNVGLMASAPVPKVSRRPVMGLRVQSAQLDSSLHLPVIAKPASWAVLRARIRQVSVLRAKLGLPRMGTIKPSAMLLNRQRLQALCVPTAVSAAGRIVPHVHLLVRSALARRRTIVRFAPLVLIRSTAVVFLLPPPGFVKARTSSRIITSMFVMLVAPNVHHVKFRTSASLLQLMS